jgi:hypothetical protein
MASNFAASTHTAAILFGDINGAMQAAMMCIPPLSIVCGRPVGCKGFLWVHACDQALSGVRPREAAVHTPRAFMEMRESGPNRLGALVSGVSACEGIDTLPPVTCQYRWLAQSRSQQNQSLAIVAADRKGLQQRLYWVNVSMPRIPLSIKSSTANRPSMFPAGSR